jgi:hypothetical protein
MFHVKVYIIEMREWFYFALGKTVAGLLLFGIMNAAESSKSIHMRIHIKYPVLICILSILKTIGTEATGNDQHWEKWYNPPCLLYSMKIGKSRPRYRQNRF